jgi:hypothetical protein
VHQIHFGDVSRLEFRLRNEDFPFETRIIRLITLAVQTAWDKELYQTIQLVFGRI